MSCTSPDPPDYCSAESPELKLYQAFIFSVPVFFTFVLLLFFYLFYLRRRRANWQSLRMRTNNLIRGDNARLECGLKKEMREMLPVVIFKESFLIRETQCSVCLAEYEPDERLQKIPPCGHTFHINCIDHWLSTNTTCPLCRVSLLPAPKATSTGLDLEAQTAVEEESPNAHHRQEEGLVDANTPQEGEAAGGDGSSSVQVEELHGDAAEPLAVTVVAVAAPQADAEGSPSTACQTVKGKK
ncbi:RING-H2 finger protein ATL7 [Zea mays]|uniref:RING-type E3 ubiquitin transferase n=2 Tax=Zea mays TaxID=4577 RepID=B4FCG3_MAIZE|nr:RING-H2 finger protein ATL7 [Zea mays]ACF79806.1 unknown [Zea mays]ACF86422.1 unknown [Zea mays]ACN31184.1 unknown [Zea mays]ACR36867.1 unknown [Zea mays]AQK71782.1 RING-H2 finger protein ATL7 [Zea mays]|eukprot:NP_001131408.1 RING-H2 finger protein ATL7 [Zea mays]